MASFSISEARGSLAEAVEISQTEAVFLERHGKRAAVMVSPERFERMMDALDEIEDELAFDAAMAEEGENIPWDEVKADLGWE
ncbi:MAG: type II toxin-antitoxin system Phd/YefM family antitoxin [Solirubrobacterales bacterium]|nr:type II toxin-antitoxin system Phd/YefM family antitoxin [Solirubrobacterales bacterium]